MQGHACKALDVDTNLVLLWFVSLSCVMQLKPSLDAARMGLPAGLRVLLAVLGLTGAAALIDFDSAGLWGMGVFAVLILIPGLLQRRVRSLTYAQRFGAAIPYARLLSLIHPSPGNRQRPALLAAMAAARAGDLAQAETLLTQHSAGAEVGPQQLEAQLQLCRLRGDYGAYLALLDRQPAARRQSDVSLWLGELRALGECGLLDRLVATYSQRIGQLASPSFAALRVEAQLMVVVFCGRQQALEALLEHALRGLGAAPRSSWRAICACAAGDTATGFATFEANARGEDAELARAARSRLAHPPRIAATALSADSEAQLRAIEQAIFQESHYRRAAALKSARLTLTLLALNIALFVAEELAGGSEDALTAYRFGAVVTDRLTLADSYRLVSALFLHYGPLHLALNMAGLAALGPFVENSLGKLRTLALYLTAGVAGALLENYLPSEQPKLFVGASGCIMGLLGATVALLLLDHRASAAQPAKRRLLSLTFALGAQLVFDLSVPNVSLSAHWSGVGVGFVLALALGQGTRQKRAGNPGPSADPPSV